MRTLVVAALLFAAGSSACAAKPPPLDWCGTDRARIHAMGVAAQACDEGDFFSCDPPRPQTAETYRRAEALFAGWCTRGSATWRPEGCYKLALLFDDGLGVAQDKTRARELYALGCEHGVMAACAKLGAYYRQDGDLAKAGPLLERACRRGHEAAACAELAGVMNNQAARFAQEANFGEVVRTYRVACHGWELQLGCSELSNFRNEASRLAGLCEAGSSEQCSKAGAMALASWRNFREHARALDLLRKGCDAGNAQACGRLRSAGPPE